MYFQLSFVAFGLVKKEVIHDCVVAFFNSASMLSEYFIARALIPSLFVNSVKFKRTISAILFNTVQYQNAIYVATKHSERHRSNNRIGILRGNNFFNSNTME